MFVDASAIIAILDREPEAAEFAAKVGEARRVFYSPLAQFEAALGLVRLQIIPVQKAAAKVSDLMDSADAVLLAITPEIGTLALEAREQFGKGRHKAKLNMADCFAYACAKSHRVPILCKGDDFHHTDIQIA
jgi:ribonuclease VapC